MGITFNSYLGLIFFFWLPIFIAIYFFKKSPKKEQVSSHFLWKKVLDSKVKASWRDKFQKTALFWFQLLIFILLFFALSEPKLKSTTDHSFKVAVIIDNSASMVTKIGASNRLYQAKELASHYVTKSRSFAKLYSWNEMLSIVGDSDNFSFNLASLESTHLPNGNVETLLKRMKALKRDFDSVYFISDYVPTIVENFMISNDFSYSIVDSGTSNSYIEAVKIDRNEAGKTQAEIRYFSSISDPLQFEFKTYNLNFRVTNPANIKGYNSFSIPLQKAPEVWYRVEMLNKDGIEADNARVRFLQGRKLRVKLYNIDKYPLWSIFFRGFFSGDGRFDLDPQSKPDVSINLVNKLPEKTLEDTIYLLSGSTSDTIKGQNFTLSSVNDVTAYLSVDNFIFYSNESMANYSQDLIVSILKNGEKVSLLSKVVDSTYRLNLAESIENITNSNTSILFENLIQSYYKQKSAKEFFEVGDSLDGFQPLDTNSSFLVGSYGRDKVKRYYNFPIKESAIKQDKMSRKNYFSEIKSSNPDSLESNKDSLFMAAILFSLLVILFEWLVFVKRL
ncbi:MAG: BatA domain-containing protein [Candidatus Cloacimonetes bacterium]|nr:BatA domain-containing protein [Candidatus Cloacimonadota bacterium]